MTQAQKHQDVMDSLGCAARAGAAALQQSSAETINIILENIALGLTSNASALQAANASDLKAAREKNLTGPLLDRLTIKPAGMEAMAQGVRDIARLEDPVGVILEEWSRPNDLVIRKISVPIGVLGVIYESRPNVTIDAAALCLKSRNAVILRGGSESVESNRALHVIIQEALKKGGLPASCVQMVPIQDRVFVETMLKAHQYVDVIVPRGGRGLIEAVMKNAAMPVFAHLDGNCHIYIHKGANAEIARSVTLNAKMRRTGICGAAESLLLDESLSPAAAKAVLDDLIKAGCTIVGDDASRALDSRVGPATEADWSTEYLDAKISCKVVRGVEEAVVHINRYGSHHTESILTEDKDSAAYFLKNVDSAIVMHNASTQFADGGEFGMGAEIGIGTGKLHARGPVGVKQLTTFKYQVSGKGQIRP